MKPPVTPPRELFPSNTEMMRMLGFEPDPWQVEVLETAHKRLLLNCSRQAGKSTVVAVLGLVEALFNPLHKVVIVSRSMRQSKELFRMIRLFHGMLRDRFKQRATQQELEFDNLSRIICLPCSEETIRGIPHVNLLIIDEAARVPDELYRAVRPMLAVSGGRMICLSTPCGKRGFFYEAWANGGDDWLRISIPASKVPRITAEFLAEERRALGETWYRQEYDCAFEAVQGLVFPEMALCVVNELPAHLQPWAAKLQVGPRPGAPRPEDPWREKKWLAEWWVRRGHDWPEAYSLRDDWVREKNAEWKKDREESRDQYRKMPPWHAERYGIDLAAMRRQSAAAGGSQQSAAAGGSGQGSLPTADCSLPTGAAECQLPSGYYTLVGGVDFGFRNPFAAVWGVLDPAGVLWLVGEHYQRQRPLSHHLRYLPKQATWYADPSGANEIAEMRLADFVVRPGINALRPGIGAVAARIESGRLKILAGACPHLLAEAELYHYGADGGDRRAEQPVDESNHALAALRYLVSRLDGRHFGNQAGSDEAGRAADGGVGRPAPSAESTEDSDDDGFGWRVA